MAWAEATTEQIIDEMRKTAELLHAAKTPRKAQMLLADWQRERFDQGFADFGSSLQAEADAIATCLGFPDGCEITTYSPLPR